MAIPALDLADFQTIVKTFEHGCNLSQTEESVYAVMTPQLCMMKSVANTTNSLIASTQASVGNNTQQLDPIGTVVENIKEDNSLAAQWLGKDKNIKDIFNSKCIPCDLRINLKEQLSLKAILTGAIKDPFSNAIEQFFLNALSQINTIINMFKSQEGFIDICAFLRYLKTFLCVPDLTRILAGLAALLMQLGLELNGIFDLVIQLIGPLLVPFFMTMLDQVNKFLLLAIKPLECIIDSITNMLSKLDYSALFQTPVAFDVTLGGNATGKVNFSLNPLSSSAKQDRLDVGKAEEDLSNTRSVSVNPNDPAALAKYQSNLNTAQKNYVKAIEERDQTYITKMKGGLTQTLTAVKGALASLIQYLRELVERFNTWWNKLTGDFMKILNSIMGDGNGMLFSLQSKLTIIQLIAMIRTVISFIKKDMKCPEGKEVEVYFNNRISQGISAYTDDTGAVHIQENNDEINNALDKISTLSGNNNGLPANASQRLNTLVKFTGDMVLDSSISRTVEMLTTPVNVVFRCPLQTSVTDAEKVNKWIEELGK